MSRVSLDMSGAIMSRGWQDGLWLYFSAYFGLDWGSPRAKSRGVRSEENEVAEFRRD